MVSPPSPRRAGSIPALILLDVAMPRMDGKQFLAQAKADPVLKDIPVIVISGLDETEVAVECLDFGAEDFVTKPFRSPLLRARMRSSLARARFQAAEDNLPRAAGGPASRARGTRPGADA